MVIMTWHYVADRDENPLIAQNEQFESSTEQGSVIEEKRIEIK